MLFFNTIRQLLSIALRHNNLFIITRNNLSIIQYMEHRKNNNAGSTIKVFCRFRPFNQKQLELNAEKVHRIGAKNQLIIKDPNKSEEISFMFDKIFDTKTHQEEIYEDVGKPVLNNILDGFNGTVMAYGQTSSGKTHTMQGYDMVDRDQKGLIPRVIENLFHAIQMSPENIQFKLKTSIFEVYMQNIRDLLDVSKNNLKIRENKAGPYVQNLTEAYISEKNQLYKLIQMGQKNRITCATNMNAHSSRSHLIFMLSLNQFNNQNSQSKTSKLFLIDLAGSQKVSKTGAQGKVLQQAKKINMSLASLGKVIKSLSLKIHHIPYRDSKLTRILQDSLGGNSKTTLIVTCSPHQMHLTQTISTLRFGQNAQKIKNKPKINRELTVQQLQKIIDELQQKIEQKDSWIKILQNHISNVLNASLPKHTIKIPSSKQTQKHFKPSETQDLSSTMQFSDKISSLKQQENLLNDSEYDEDQSFTLQEQKFRKNPIMSHSVNILQTPIPQMRLDSSLMQNSSYDQQIASLEAEICNYKQNLQNELAKFYQLKKQYNSLTQNLKSVIQQNISYQEKQRKTEQALNKLKISLINKHAQNSRLILGQILNECNHQRLQNIPKLIKEKGKELLCLQEEQIRISSEGKILNFDYLDYWRTQKQAIQKKMDEVIEKSISIQNKLNQRNNQPYMATSPPSTTKAQNKYQKSLNAEIQKNCNKKIIDLQDKLDKICKQYQQVLAVQTNWKVQCQIYEFKIKSKDQKINELRGLLKQISEQMELMDEEYDQQMSVNTKIVKPIKGGFLFH